MKSDKVALPRDVHLENVDAGSLERENATVDQAPNEFIRTVGGWCRLNHLTSPFS
jgi:hypothetical protein